MSGARARLRPARHVRGSLPPLALLLVTLAGTVAPRCAADPAAAPAGSAPSAPRAAVDSLRADSTTVDSACVLSPRGALLRSAVLPGWGQLYDRRPLKAALSAAASAGLLASAIAGQVSLDRAATPAQAEDRAARRNTRLLLWAASVTFSALDAYVDAQLSTFAADAPPPLTLAPTGGGLLLSLRLPLPTPR